MTDTSKPPMVVTLNNMGTAIVKPREYYDKHTYVHLDQFLEEVEERSKYAHDNGLVGNEVLWALRDIAKEIKAGKV